MKENKGKGLANKETMPKEEEVHSQPRPSGAKKRKTLSKMVDMGSLPSHWGHKKARHGSSKSEVVKVGFVVPSTSVKQPSAVQILNLDLSNTLEVTLSKPPSGSPMTLLRSEGLAWERFQQAVSEEDVAICYNMSVKEFERSTVHDLFKVLFLILNPS